jgi:sugar phosphate isomerase/epimerase
MTQLQVGATLCFRPYSLDDALRGLSEAGFRYVEIGAVKDWLENLDPDDISAQALRRARQSLRRHGLQVVSVSGHSQLQTRQGMDRLRRVLHATRDLGAGVLNTYTGDVATEDDYGNLLKHIRTVADEAQQLDISLCLETDSNLVSTGAAGREILKRIGHPWVRLNYDTGNVAYYAGARADEDIDHALPVLGHVHLKDQRGGKAHFDFPPLGEGEIDIGGVLRKLDEIGFAGPVSMEIEFDGNWPSWESCLDATKRGKDHWDALVAAAARAGHAAADTDR